MDFTYTPEEEAFRSRLRLWLSSALPGGWGETLFEPKDEEERAYFRLDWDRKLFAGGWAGLNWPASYGGRGGTLVEQAIFAEEMARAHAPEGLNIIGRNLVGTTLLHHGTEEQKRRFLPKILSAEEVWCQGFSEPDAGSDLASVRTRAVIDGDHFIVNGQKVWTSFAQFSQWCFALVRTDPDKPKHEGLSFILIDMSTPGITIRPLKQMSGESEFNETFFDNVRVPVANLVGALNGGWKIAMTTLAYERGPEDALARQIRFRQELDQLLTGLQRLPKGAGKAIDDPVLRQKLGQSVIDMEIMRLNSLRAFSKYLKGGPRGPEASAIKLYWSHAAQQLYDTAMEALGPLALLGGDDGAAPSGGRFQLSYLQSRAFTIYSGASEIQRNVIGERMLGLPR